MHRLALASAVFLAAIPAAIAGRSEGRELIEDPGFESGELKGFFLVGPFDPAVTRIERDPAGAHDGRRYLRLAKLPGLKDGRHGAFLGRDITAEVRPGDRLDLSVWIRFAANRNCEAVAGIVILDDRDRPQFAETRKLAAAAEWTEISLAAILPDKSVLGDWKRVFAFVAVDPVNGAAGAMDAVAEARVDDLRLRRARPDARAAGPAARK